MKTLFTFLFLFFSIVCFSQRIDESNVTISMSLESVSSILVLPDNYIRVANTETMLINFDVDKYIEVTPGIHRFKLDVEDITNVVLIPKTGNQLDYIANKVRIIKNGQEDVNTLTGHIIQRDYLEYTILNYFEH
jgi:uncharacterized protein YqjF (DUF2071 family)